MHTTSVYLLCFIRRYPRGRQPQHYRGSAVDLTARIEEHWRVWRRGLAGHRRSVGDCALIHAMGVEGIPFRVVQVIPGDRRDERYFKNWGSQRQLCPECAPLERERRAAKDRERRRVARANHIEEVRYVEAA